jgi:hypothetical protein
MSNNNKEKIYFAAATNLITMVVVIFMPLLFGECELFHWYFSKLSFDKDIALSKWIMILPLLAMVIIVILFIRGIRKTDFVSSSVEVTNKTNSQRIAERQKIIMQEQEKLATKKMQAVKSYLIESIAPYVEEEELMILINNVQNWEKDQGFVPEAITTNGQLNTLDMKHLAWNVGKRLDWTGKQCATFIKICFPIEMKDIEIETIRRNLRQKGPCIIELDVPENGSYEFHYSTSE